MKSIGLLPSRMLAQFLTGVVLLPALVAQVSCAKNQGSANVEEKNRTAAEGGLSQPGEVGVSSTGDCSWLVGKWSCGAHNGSQKRFLDVTEINVPEVQALRIGMAFGHPPSTPTDFRDYILDGEWREALTVSGRDLRRRAVCVPGKLEISSEIADSRDNPALVTTLRKSSDRSLELSVAPEGEDASYSVIVPCTRELN